MKSAVSGSNLIRVYCSDLSEVLNCNKQSTPNRKTNNGLDKIQSRY